MFGGCGCIHYLDCGDCSMGIHVADVLFTLLCVDYCSKMLVKKLNCHDEWLSRKAKYLSCSNASPLFKPYLFIC